MASRTFTEQLRDRNHRAELLLEIFHRGRKSMFVRIAMLTELNKLRAERVADMDHGELVDHVLELHDNGAHIVRTADMSVIALAYELADMFDESSLEEICDAYKVKIMSLSLYMQHVILEVHQL